MIAAGKRFDPVVARKCEGIGEQYIMSIRHRTMADLIADVQNHPTISSIEHYHSTAKLVGLLGICIDFLSRMARVRRGFDPDGSMTSMLTELLLLKYPGATMADIKFCLIEHAGSDLYDRLDANVILGWMKDHWERRLALSQARKRLEHEKERSKAAVPMPKEIQAKMIDLHDRIQKKKIQEKLKAKRTYHSLQQYSDATGTPMDELHDIIHNQASEQWPDMEAKYTEAGLTEADFITILTNKFLIEKSY